MTEYYRFELENGGSVLVEPTVPPEVARAGRKQATLQNAALSFEKALVGARDAAASALDQFQAMSPLPNEVEITFGVKLDVTAGAVIAQAGVHGHFEVKLKWQREPAPPAAG